MSKLSTEAKLAIVEKVLLKDGRAQYNHRMFAQRE